MKTSQHQEGMFFKNKWDFAKKATNGTLNDIPEHPTFSKNEADKFYPSTYSELKIVDLTKCNNRHKFQTIFYGANPS